MSFSKALKQIKRSEGGYVFDPDDVGGETYVGISRKFFPKWKGWKILDHYKKHSPRNIKTNTIYLNSDLDRFIEEFYLKYFWKPLKCDKIKNPIIAEHLFDCGINLGKKSAVKFFQETMNHLPGGSALVIDGLIGPKTIGAINEEPKIFANYLVHYRIGLYFSKCYKKQVKFKYLKGWCLRSLKYLDK